MMVNGPSHALQPKHSMRSTTKTAIGFMNTFMAIRAQALGHHIKPVGLAWLRNSSSNKANTEPLPNRIH
jgi:hypothetical protein